MVGAGSDGDDLRWTAFAGRLAELKAEGSAVLVVGSESSEGHRSLCRRLHGTDSPEPRRRILVGADDVDALRERLPTEHGSSADSTLISVSNVRSATTESIPAAALSGVDVVELGDASLARLGIGITEAVERIETRHGPIEPSEVRFGLESLAPLLDVYGEQRVFSFLVVLTRYFRAFGVLGHVHLRCDTEGYVTRLLAPLFDIVVEVRALNGQPQHRWHLDDGALTSRWLSL